MSVWYEGQEFDVVWDGRGPLTDMWPSARREFAIHAARDADMPGRHEFFVKRLYALGMYDTISEGGGSIGRCVEALSEVMHTRFWTVPIKTAWMLFHDLLREYERSGSQQTPAQPLRSRDYTKRTP